MHTDGDTLVVVQQPCGRLLTGKVHWQLLSRRSDTHLCLLLQLVQGALLGCPHSNHPPHAAEGSRAHGRPGGAPGQAGRRSERGLGEHCAHHLKNVNDQRLLISRVMSRGFYLLNSFNCAWCYRNT